MTGRPLFPAERAGRLAVAGSAAVALLAMALLPSGIRLPIGPPCVFHAMTGLPCALCGGTRAAQAFLHGDFAGALHLNAIAIPAVIALVLVAGMLVAEAAIGRAFVPWPSFLRHPFPILAAALLFAWWVPHLFLSIRNRELIDVRHPVARLIAGEIPAAPQ